jgi:muramoyltetrapeptide carboxypeptidase
MIMIRYPVRKIATIGVTAPSSGVGPALHGILNQSVKRMEERGFTLKVGDTAWTQSEAKSADAEKRAEELMGMFEDPIIDMVIPPWGGELLIEILEHLDFEAIPEKWILGYSDTSALMLPITLKTGIATAHGTNLVDLRGPESDALTAKWLDVLTTQKGDTITQVSSDKYQKKWDFENPTPVIFDLTEKTHWKTVSGEKEQFSGRLLGGCIDVIRHLIGTPFGDVERFREEFIPGDPVIWYLENCELNVADLKRSLTQMKYAGWFHHISGIVFGRSAANGEVEGYTIEKMYEELSLELGVPIAYDLDLGHVPPQITFVNGAYAEIEVEKGKGRVVQEFK